MLDAQLSDEIIRDSDILRRYVKIQHHVGFYHKHEESHCFRYDTNDTRREENNNTVTAKKSLDELMDEESRHGRFGNETLGFHELTGVMIDPLIHLLGGKQTNSTFPASLFWPLMPFR